MFPSAQLFKHYIESTTHRYDNNILWPYKYDAFIRLSIRTKIYTGVVPTLSNT
jgi:hypothetical protein